MGLSTQELKKKTKKKTACKPRTASACGRAVNKTPAYEQRAQISCVQESNIRRVYLAKFLINAVDV